MARRSEKEILTTELIRASVARFLILASHSEQYLEKTDMTETAKKTLNKMSDIADSLRPISDKKVRWLRDMHIGMSIDNICDFYESFCDGKITSPGLATKVLSHWQFIFRSPLADWKLKMLSEITPEHIVALGGPKKAAMINVGRAFDYGKGEIGSEEVPTRIQEIYKKYNDKEERKKLPGLMVGADASLTHRSFIEEPTWRFLIGYCLDKLMEIPISDSVKLLNQIGELKRQQEAIKQPDC